MPQLKLVTNPSDDTQLDDKRRMLNYYRPNMDGKNLYWFIWVVLFLKKVYARTRIDWIFTHIGVADNLASDRSTFIVLKQYGLEIAETVTSYIT